ncbi:flavin reductase domain protein FMN-binding [Leptothrix cholodnii SP-6]|uniref:Flavin reductase domain protein FMN-binding n=1 Tax=Leptothrix cholodnii (strain ATCC 51168 / LMG 8142 / SP-6) TaxID=395495 RepID=B1Y1U5_LEPCP|nr:flavin reductase family protein [Leptothrix cholodnii]ACB33125.1 flavin reductase domain protein FMN-binding [Leptothrix cholodnii SP-6]
MSAMPALEERQLSLSANLKEAMRRLASSVAIITSRDQDGQPHGMAASAVIPVSMDPPSMLVAVNRDAGLHPVLQRSGRYCINLLADDQHLLLKPFSQTALRDQRFRSDDWRDAWSPADGPLPWLDGAPAAIECEVDQFMDYGTHTLFVGRVVNVRCASAESSTGTTAPQPLVWLAGQRARLVSPI